MHMDEMANWYNVAVCGLRYGLYPYVFISLLMMWLWRSSGVYHFSVPELAEVGSEVGVVKATDADTGKNAEMNYRITDEQDTFLITTDPTTQDGVLILKKVCRLIILKHLKAFLNLKSHWQAKYLHRQGFFSSLQNIYLYLDICWILHFDINSVVENSALTGLELLIRGTQSNLS